MSQLDHSAPTSSNKHALLQGQFDVVLRMSRHMLHLEAVAEVNPWPILWLRRKVC